MHLASASVATARANQTNSATTEMRVRVTAALVSASSKGATPVRFPARLACTAASLQFAETATSTTPRLATTATRHRTTAARQPATSSWDGAARSQTNLV